MSRTRTDSDLVKRARLGRATLAARLHIEESAIEFVRWRTDDRREMVVSVPSGELWVIAMLDSGVRAFRWNPDNTRGK